MKSRRSSEDVILDKPEVDIDLGELLFMKHGLTVDEAIGYCLFFALTRASMDAGAEYSDKDMQDMVAIVNRAHRRKNPRDGMNRVGG